MCGKQTENPRLRDYEEEVKFDSILAVEAIRCGTKIWMERNAAASGRY